MKGKQVKTLIINTHPLYGDNNHFSQKLMKLFIEKYKENFNTYNLEILNLYEQDIPVIDKNMLTMWAAQATGLKLDDSQKQLAKRQKELLEQFNNSHRVVIVAPTYNFNITSKMKDYMDNVLIARETFMYTEEGPKGLMTDDYRVMLLAASGSINVQDGRVSPIEFQNHYLKTAFCDIMGFDSFHIVRAQGVALRTADEVMMEATRNLDIEFKKFYQ